MYTVLWNVETERCLATNMTLSTHRAVISGGLYLKEYLRAREVAYIILSQDIKSVFALLPSETAVISLEFFCGIAGPSV